MSSRAADRLRLRRRSGQSGRPPALRREFELEIERAIETGFVDDEALDLVLQQRGKPREPDALVSVIE